MRVLASFFRWLVGAIAAVVMLATQVGPKEAASRLSEWATFIGVESVPPWLASQAADKWAFWTGLSIVAALVGWWLVKYYSGLVEKRRLHHQQIVKENGTNEVSETFHAEQRPPSDTLIPMPEAARLAYEELREIGSMWAGAADRLAARLEGESRNDAALRYMAVALHNQDVPIYGAHPPSRRRELIDLDEFKRGGFDNAGATFSYYMEKEPRYVDLAVRKGELAAAIEKMKGDSRKKQTSLRVSPQAARAARVAQRVAEAGEAIANAFQQAERKLQRLEKLQEEAHLAHGYDPNSKEARDKAVLLLANLRTEGVEIRNAAKDVLDDTLATWLEEVDDWMRAVIDGLDLIDPADAEIFKTLDIVSAPRVGFDIGVLNPDHVQKFLHHYAMHDLRLSRLFDFLQKYQGVTFKRG
jgi:hypothetical protein